MMSLLRLFLCLVFTFSTAHANRYFLITKDVIPVITHDGPLDNLITDFIDMSPKDKIYAEVALTLLFDSEVRDAYKYLKSKEFYTLVANLQKRDVYVQLLEYLEQEGLDVQYYFNEARKYINIPPYGIFLKSGKVKTMLPSGGVDGLVKRLIGHLPINEIKSHYIDQLAKHEDLKDSITNIYSAEFLKMVGDVRELPEYTVFEQKVKSQGIDIEKYLVEIYRFFGISP